MSSLVMPGGRFCGSARQSRHPSELPQIFQVAVERRSWSLNQAFCSAPRIVCGGASLRGFGTCPSLKLDFLGGLPLSKARPPSRICTRLRGTCRELVPPIGPSDGSLERIWAAEAVLVGDDEVEVPAVAQGAIGDQAVDRGEIVGLDAETVIVEFLDRHVLHSGRVEFAQATRSARHTRRDGIRTRPGWRRP